MLLRSFQIDARGELRATAPQGAPLLPGQMEPEARGRPHCKKNCLLKDCLCNRFSLVCHGMGTVARCDVHFLIVLGGVFCNATRCACYVSRYVAVFRDRFFSENCFAGGGS